MKYTILAEVRKRGAIGVFYIQTFKVTTAGQPKDAWFSKYGDVWELNHFISITPEG